MGQVQDRTALTPGKSNRGRRELGPLSRRGMPSSRCAPGLEPVHPFEQSNGSHAETLREGARVLGRQRLLSRQAMLLCI